ncbi:hypothetical protein [uncultured Friedmanniella sp.]|uniref:hypothetical protein n=1 Tax=uncultured Friedmanniella sp. TaxID=335381 RepID=UPI0035C9A5F7
MDFDDDLTMAQTLLERLGGALTVDDILILRGAGVWHRIQWELGAEREEGLSGRQRAPFVTREQKVALKAAGMPSRPARRKDLGTRIYSLDPEPVQARLNRAEVAAGYLHALHGIQPDGEAASFFSEGEPALGPTAIMTVWDRIAAVDPELALTEHEKLWTQGADLTQPWTTNCG